MFTEPHSTKPIEDCVGWGLETTGETLVLTSWRPAWNLTSHGSSRDASAARSWSFTAKPDAHRSPRAAGSPSRSTPAAQLVLLEGSGHAPHVRDPVKVNLLLAGFREAGSAAAALGAGEVAS